MTRQKPTSSTDTRRLNLTVSRALYDDIMFLSSYMKISASGLVNQLICESIPYMAAELRKVAASPDPDEAIRRLRGESKEYVKAQYDLHVASVDFDALEGAPHAH